MVATRRDRRLWDALAFRVAYLTPERVAVEYCANAANPLRTANRLLLRHCRSGYLQRVRLLVRTPLPALEQLFVWEPGEPFPNPQVLSSRTCERWRRIHDVREETAFAATDLLKQLVGGGSARLPLPSSDSHELYAMELHFHFRRVLPGLAACWTHESSTAEERAGLVHPDIEFVDKSGKPFRLLEVMGSYPPRRVNALLRSAAARNLPLELW